MTDHSIPRFCALAAPLVWLALPGAARAAEQVSSVRITTEPPGLEFLVDGVPYRKATSFLWPLNSKHEVAVSASQISTAPRARYSFKSWSDPTGALNFPNPTLQVTASPALTSITANFDTGYSLRVAFFRCGDPNTACASPGTVYIGGTGFTQDTEIYVQPNSVVQVQAVPNRGYIFMGWQQSGANAQAFFTSVTMDQPKTIWPRFVMAGNLKLETSPPGLQVLADRTPVFTPITLDWGLGTTHTVSPISPQTDIRDGKTYVFESWSDGAEAVHAYTMPDDLTPKGITARYVLAARATFLTSPPGLKLKIDGRENWLTYSFSWAPGSRHTVAAAGRQQDAQGRVWFFRGWSNGGSASQEITIPDDADATGFRLTAAYEAAGVLNVRSDPAGIAVEVDGQACTAPCSTERAAGTTVHLRAPAFIAPSDGSRLDFAGWSDGGAIERDLILDGQALTLTASYRQRYRLDVASEPAKAARLSADPASPDSYYDAGQAVTVNLEVKPGFRFRGWQGDLRGSSRSAIVSMTAPRFARALFDAVPYVPPGGVRNAAVETPVDAVAPGSIVSIFGANLAGGSESGPPSPLAQVLAGVSVKVNDRILGLFSVSPELINAQLPPDLGEGPAKLTVRSEAGPDIAVEFTVARNAPGLFAVEKDGRRFAAAAHADGTVVSMENPAKRGELITLLGTGFGPYERRPPEGFAVPAKPEFPLADGAEVLQGETVFPPEFAGAAPGQIGMDALRIRITGDWPSGTLEIRARVGGRESNTVLLPVE